MGWGMGKSGVRMVELGAGRSGGGNERDILKEWDLIGLG